MVKWNSTDALFVDISISRKSVTPIIGHDPESVLEIYLILGSALNVGHQRSSSKQFDLWWNNDNSVDSMKEFVQVCELAK